MGRKQSFNSSSIGQNQPSITSLCQRVCNDAKDGRASSQWFEMDPLDDSTDPVFKEE